MLAVRSDIAFLRGQRSKPNVTYTFAFSHTHTLLHQFPSVASQFFVPADTETEEKFLCNWKTLTEKLKE